MTGLLPGGPGPGTSPGRVNRGAGVEALAHRPPTVGDVTTHRPETDRAFLRRSVLAVAVLDDVDLDLDDDGVHVPGCTPLAWADVAGWAAAPPAAPGRDEADHALDALDAARARVRDLVLAHRELHRGGPRRSGSRRVALAVPTGAARHPGAGWVSRRVLGGALDLGLGVVVRDGRTERALPVPQVTARALGVADAPSGADREHLEAMAALLVDRLLRDAGTRGGDVLRPVGGCDVPTLLASSTLRTHLVAGPDRSAGSLLAAVAVPDRTRGWFDLAHIDPAYAAAAWSVTDLRDRGFRRPVLVTRDEVALVPDNPRIGEFSLRHS